MQRQATLKLEFAIVGGGQYLMRNESLPLPIPVSFVDDYIILSGLAGLATAHALALAGHRVRVFEATDGTVRFSASAFRVTPNGSKVLQQWGVWDDYTRRACTIPSTECLDSESLWGLRRFPCPLSLIAFRN